MRAASIAVLLVFGGAAVALADAPSHAKLVPGTPLAFVADRGYDAGRGRDATIAVRLTRDLMVDGEMLATAGSTAQLVVGTQKITDETTHEKRTILVGGLEQFRTRAGLVPIRLAGPLPAEIAAGTPIDAIVTGEVSHEGGRWSVRTPFPYTLSADRPSSDYTPTPARTPGVFRQPSAPPIKPGVPPAGSPPSADPAIPTRAPTGAPTPINGPVLTLPAPTPAPTKIP